MNCRNSVWQVFCVDILHLLKKSPNNKLLLVNIPHTIHDSIRQYKNIFKQNEKRCVVVWASLGSLRYYRIKDRGGKIRSSVPWTADSRRCEAASAFIRDRKGRCVVYVVALYILYDCAWGRRVGGCMRVCVCACVWTSGWVRGKGILIFRNICIFLISVSPCHLIVVSIHTPVSTTCISLKMSVI